MSPQLDVEIMSKHAEHQVTTPKELKPPEIVEYEELVSSHIQSSEPESSSYERRRLNKHINISLLSPVKEQSPIQSSRM